MRGVYRDQTAVDHEEIATKLGVPLDELYVCFAEWELTNRLIVFERNSDGSPRSYEVAMNREGRRKIQRMRRKAQS